MMSDAEGSLEVFKEHYARIDAHLAALLHTTGVRYGLLVDRKGFVLSHKEADWATRPPALDSVATLVANNAAATAALAQMLGERTFSEQVHQGENGTLYVESVGEQALLTLIFDSSVPLGKVKVHAKKTVSLMAGVLEELKAVPQPSLNQGFSDGATALLDDLLG